MDVRHQRPRRTLVLPVLTVLICLLSSCGLLSRSPKPVTTPPPPTSPYARYLAAGRRALATATASVHLALPRRPGSPAPSLPPRPCGKGLGSKT
ncbi:MAG: hypothetical protein ACYDBS_11980, partial [Acidimicrobiales bacterium]